MSYNSNINYNKGKWVHFDMHKPTEMSASGVSGINMAKMTFTPSLKRKHAQYNKQAHYHQFCNLAYNLPGLWLCRINMSSILKIT
jgi:hypothetical protein